MFENNQPDSIRFDNGCAHGTLASVGALLEVSPVLVGIVALSVDIALDDMTECGHA